MAKDPESYSNSKAKRSSSKYCGCLARILLLLMMTACLVMVMDMFLEMQKLKQKFDFLESYNGDRTYTQDNRDNQKENFYEQKVAGLEEKVTLLELSNMRQTQMIQRLRQNVYKLMNIKSETEVKSELSNLFENINNDTMLRKKREANDNAAEQLTITECLQGPVGRDGRDGKDGRDGLSAGQGISAPELKHILSTFKESLQKIYQQGSHNSVNTSQTNVTTGGSVYIRWGRKSCSSSAELVYEGVVAGSSHSHTGGGGEKICLPRVPQWAKYVDGFQSGSYVYGAEYQIYPGNPEPFSHLNTGGLSSIHDHDVPCAVCYTPNRPTHVMIPAWKECPADWTKEYNGYLMAEHYTHQRSSFNCMDEAPEVIQGGKTNHNGALFYLVEAQCGSLLCPNYVSGRELTCVVCTK